MIHYFYIKILKNIDVEIRFPFAGDIILHAQMAVEILGRWKNPRPHDGSRRGRLHRNRKETKEEAHDRLFVGEPALPQLVGLQILLL